MNMITKTFSLEKSDAGYVAGIITTGNEDRDGDIIDPGGADTSFLNSLLAFHDHKNPVGSLVDIQKRPEGIWAKFKFSATQKAQEARQLVTDGALAAFSIGFQPLPDSTEPRDGGGWLYKSVEILEVSLVPVQSNRQSLVTEVKSFPNSPKEGEDMNTTTAPAGKVKTVPGVSSGTGNEYNLISVLQKMSQGQPVLGFEAEVSQELAKSCEGISDGPGIIVPEVVMRGGRVMDARMANHLKAAGALTGDNLLPLTGIGHHDELFRYVDDAITRQDIYAQIGATEITCTEATCRIPVMETPATATHVGVDDDLADSQDLGFRNVDIKPVKLGTVMEVLLSAMLAQHPQMYINQILAELNRALNQEKARALIYGVKGTDKIDGLLSLATAATTASIPVSDAAKGKVYEIIQQMETYFQGDFNGRWLLQPGFVDGLKTVAEFSGGHCAALLDDTSRILGGVPYLRSVGLTVAGATGSKTADGILIGDPTAVVHPVWMGVRLDVNPWADSVYKKGAAILRAHMLHGFALSDPKAVLKFKTSVPG